MNVSSHDIDSWLVFMTNVVVEEKALGHTVDTFKLDRGPELDSDELQLPAGRRVDGMYPRHDLVNIWKWKRLDETATVAQPAQAPKAAQPASDAPKASPTQQPASSAPLPPSTDADGHQEQGGRLERIHKREDDAGQALPSLSGHLPAVRRGRYATRPRARTAPLRRAGGGV